MPFDPQLQRKIMGRFATGVTVVTTRAGGELHGMTANAVTSLSLNPSLVLVAVDCGSQMCGHLRTGQAFAINILAEDQEHLSRRFAQKGPKDFSDLATITRTTGSPILADALAWLDCRLSEVLRGGDHDIYLGEILEGAERDGRPLLFYAGKYGRWDSVI